MKIDENVEILSKLTPSILDALRGVVEWVDTALAKEARRDFEFREGQMQDESGFLGAIFGRLSGDAKLSEIKVVEKSLKGDWGVFTDKGDGILQLNYATFAVFKTALKKSLLKQPYGYERSLERPHVKPEALVEQKDDRVYLRFGDERPIFIANAENNQGKLLLFLGRPLGANRTISSVLQELGVEEPDALRYAMKEVQRKLAKHKKRNLVRLRFAEDTVWIEIK